MACKCNAIGTHLEYGTRDLYHLSVAGDTTDNWSSEAYSADAWGERRTLPGSADFQTLELLFRRAGCLPALPSTAIQLVKTIDTGEASASHLERIIASDPALSAEFLRMASIASVGGVPRYSTIRGAIMLLGQRTVRSLAMSLILRHMSFARPKTPNFDSIRFSRHSLGVAMIARFLFAHRQMARRVETNWTVDEVFAVGLLSSLGIGLIARVAPDAYDRVFHYSKRATISLEAGFQIIYGKPSTLLTATAVDAWELPPVFSSALIHLDEPWTYPEEFTALCCLNYSIALSDSNDLGIGQWEIPLRVGPEVELESSITPEEQQGLVDAVRRQVDEWVRSSGRAA
jgi:HD-like signal output (HDOD) protein